LIDKLSKKPKINVRDGSYTTLVTFQEITDIQNNKKKYKLLDPPFQVSFDDDKIEEMVGAYIKNPQFLLSKLVITIAIVTIDGATETYLMDGQHRMEMIKQIYENFNENDNVIFAVQQIYSEREMILLFEELNKDSTKSKPYVSLPIFSKKKAEDIKKLLEEKFRGAYAKTKNSKGVLYTVGEFMNELIENDYLEGDNNNKSAEAIIKNIDTLHKKYLNNLKYLENGQNDKLYTQTEMNTIRDYKNVMFFKNNNFINHIVSGDIPMHDDLIRRSKISDDLRKNVWEKTFGTKTVGICPVKYCNHEISNKKFGFQCGHIISVANKGKETLDNLSPICADCNSKMSSTNWDEYEEELERDMVWNDLYENEDDGNCTMCEDKIVTRENFYLIKIKNKKGKKISKIVCKKCSKK
jgi:hypothetical protein